MGGQQPGVVVVEHLRILVHEAKRRGRLRGDDVIALADGVGEDGHVPPRQRRAWSSAPQAIDAMPADFCSVGT